MIGVKQGIDIEGFEMSFCNHTSKSDTTTYLTTEINIDGQDGNQSDSTFDLKDTERLIEWLQLVTKELKLAVAEVHFENNPE